MVSLKLTHLCELLLPVPQVELATLVQRGMKLWADISPSAVICWHWTPSCSQSPLGTFHPWSCMDVLANIHGRTHSFPLIHPRGVLLTWCKVGARQSAHCGDSSFSLPSRVGSSGGKLVHLAHAVHTPAHGGMPISSTEVMRSQLQWRICDQPYWSFMMYKGTSFMTWHSTSFSLSSNQSLIFLFLWHESAFI